MGGPAGGSSRGTTLATLFGLISLGLVGWGVHEHVQAREAREQLKHCHEERAILEDPEVQTLTLVPNAGRKTPFTAKVNVKYSEKNGVMIIGDGLPDPGAGKCYKLWSIAKTDDPKKPLVLPMRAFGWTTAEVWIIGNR